MITMKPSTRPTGFFKPTGRKTVVALVFASLLGGLSISPAFAERNNDHDRHDRHERHDRRHDRHGDYQGEGRRDHRREWRRDHHVYRYQPEYRRPYYYAQPVYVPPPAYYYSPPRAPSINVYIPFDLNR